jgi:hypothetical protein
MATDNRAAIAQSIADAFTTGTRTDGTEYVFLADGHPDWMRDIMHAAHGDMLPDDYRYSMIRECISSLTDRDPDDWEDDVIEIADGLVDVYNHARVKWLESSLARGAYCDDALEEGLASADSGIYAIIGIGQYMEYREILGALIQAIEERAEEESADDSADDAADDSDDSAA